MAFAVLALWMATIYFPWWELADKENSLAILFTALQFPWRYLSLATVFLCFLTIYSIQKLEIHGHAWFQLQKAGTKIMFVLVIIQIIIVGTFFAEYSNTALVDRTLSATTDVMTDALYFPEGLSTDLLYDTSIHCDPRGAALIDKSGVNESNERLFFVDSVRDAYDVAFPIAYYKFLTAYAVEDGVYLETFAGYNQQLAVSLEPGFTGTIRISYCINWRWKAAYIVSALSAILLIVYSVRLKLRSSDGHSNESIK